MANTQRINTLQWEKRNKYFHAKTTEEFGLKFNPIFPVEGRNLLFAKN